jgi:hypothetical protein
MFAAMRLFLLAFLLIGTTSYSQGFWKNAEIGIQGNYGSFFTSSSKADFVKDSYTFFGEISISKPVRSFPLPSKTYPLQWGTAIYFGSTGSQQYIGKMGGAYGFLDFGIIGSKLTSLRMRTGLGLGFVEFPYDAETNHKNVVIGSKTNLFIHAALKNVWHINQKWNLNAGVSISHLSNATTKLPNLGLNIPAFTAGISTFINRSAFEKITYRDSFLKKWNAIIQLTAGIKQVPWVNSKRYGQMILSSEFLYQPNRFGRYGGGLAITYDPSQDNFFIDSVITVGIKNYPAINLALFASYEIILGRVSIPIQLGAALLDTKKRIYQNYGIRYRLTGNLSLAGYLRTHGGTADFLHGGISYHFK